MNLVALIGNVANEPELRHTQSGTPVCTFRFAVSRPHTDDADFFTVVAWETLAETANKYLQTGRRISVQGRLHHSTWETDGGKRRSRVEIVAQQIEFLGASRDAHEEIPDDADPTPDDASEAIRASDGTVIA